MEVPMSSYYYRHLDYRHGPAEADDLRYMLQKRLLPGRTLIWPIDQPEASAVALTSLLDPAPYETGCRPAPELPAQAVPAPACTRCAAPLIPHAHFCPQCGTPAHAAQKPSRGARRPSTLPWQEASRVRRD